MKKKSLLWISALLLMLAGCSSDDENDSEMVAVNPVMLVGEWDVSHKSMNPKYADTADLWFYSFMSNGTGFAKPLGTGSFRYELNGNRITLHLLNTEAYWGQTVFEYKIVSISNDMMEWEEIPEKNWGDNSLYLKFYRKGYRYTRQNLSPQDSLTVGITVDGRTVTSYGNIITQMTFNPPVSLSPEQLSPSSTILADYLPQSEDNLLKFNGSLKNSQINYVSFLQYYKDIMVWRCSYVCYLNQDDALEKAEGMFVPIEDLNVHPVVSEDYAKAILRNALHTDDDIPLTLVIVPFFADGKVDVHLAYELEEWEGCFAHYSTFVDAHTGEILCYRQ